MRRREIILLCLLAILLIPSCSEYIPFLEEKAGSFAAIGQRDGIVCISENNGDGRGKPVTLTVGFTGDGDRDYSYQWFSCSDENKSNAARIEGATEKTYTTGYLGEIGKVYYYYCEITGKEGLVKRTKETKVYYVCCTGLPTLIINTSDNVEIINKTDKIPATIRFVSATQDLESESTIKGRGNASWDYFPKRSYTIKLDKKTAFGSLPKSKKWALVSNYNDKTLLRNWFASFMDNSVLDSDSNWNPSYLHVDCILNGEYIGNYTLVEQIRIDDNRLNLPDISKQADPADGGFILEVNWRMDEAYNFISDHGVTFSLKDPDLEDLDAGQAEAVFSYIRSVINYAESVLYSGNYDQFASCFDILSFVDWYIVNEIAKTWDGRFRTSVYMYYDPADSLIHMGPDWDYDDSWGGSDSYDRLSTDGFYLNDCAWYSQLFKCPDFVSALKDRWNDRKAAIIDSVNHLQTMSETIAVSADLNFKKWDILGTRAFTAAPGYRKRKTYQSEIDFMKNWIIERINWLDPAINSL